MTTDPTPTLLRDRLPSDAGDLHALLLTEHADRAGQLGEAWWRVVRDAYEGTGGFMRSVAAASTSIGGASNTETGRGALPRGTYLTPFRRESVEAFTARANRSAYTNHVAPVIDVYHGHLVRRRAERVSAIAAINAWWADADGRGHDVGEWVAVVALRAQLIGWCAVLIDRPDTEDTSAVRTTATALDPGELRDWHMGLDGRLEWCRIVSQWCERDPATGEDVEYLEATIWTRTEWARVRMVEGEREQWSEVERTGAVHSLGRVPIAVLRWQEQVRPRSLYGLSQVQGVVPLALALYANESELTDHLSNANFALLAVNGEPDALTNLAIGTNNGMTYPVGTNPPAFISPGADVAMQYALRAEQLRAAIYTAAKMEPPGAKADGGDAASGIARAYDFSQTDAGLQTFARQLTRFEHECVAIVAAWSAPANATPVAVAALVAAATDATTITYPTRFDAAGIRDDLGAMFAALDDKVRAQMPPAVVREARLGIARGLFPEVAPSVEAEYAAEIATMYARELEGAASQKARVSELFGYDLDAGLITVNEYLAGKGLPPRVDGNVTIIEWRVAHGLAPDGSLPSQPVDLAADAAATTDAAIAALPLAVPGALTTATP